MKKQIFYGIACLFFMSEACQSDSTKLKIGDAVLYDYVVKQGDSVIYKAAHQTGDTASMLLEDINSNEPIKQALVKRVMSMSVNDSLSFELANQQKGFLRLYRIIPATAFPKYIEEADKRSRAFEQRLHEIGKELHAAFPLTENRRKAVLDSAITFFDQYKRGELSEKLTKLGADNLYYTVKGSGKVQPERKKWVWFHYVTISPDNKIVDSYKGLPKGTNISEFPLDEALERGAASFDEGSILLLITPSERQNTSKMAKNTPHTLKNIYWVEVVKVIYF
jgi:hypothetical protein